MQTANDREHQHEILAERLFYIEGEEPSGPAVIFRLWRPSQEPAGDARCRCELITRTEVTTKEAPGIDQLDSILNCLSLAGSTVAGWNESIFGGRLRWAASPSGGRGLGLPTIEDNWPDPQLYRRELQWAFDQQQRTQEET